MPTLVDAGATPDLADRAGRTPLMFAAYQGRLKVLTLLLDRGANMNLVSAAEYTALDYAAKGLELACARLLHERGAKMGDIASVMSFVCDQGNVEIAKIVLAHGPSLDALDGNGVSGLHYAALLLSEEEACDPPGRAGRGELRHPPPCGQHASRL